MKTIKLIKSILAAVLVIGILAGCNSTKNTENAELTVYAAKSMSDCLDELIANYNKAGNGNVKISTNYASSGDLQAQIENGAPCDIFLSAAQKQMDALCEEDLIAEDTRTDLLTNEAVLVVPADSNIVTSFQDLAADTVEKVAIGNPESVPAGQYAQEILTTLGIWDAVSQKAVLGSDVRQVLAWCETGEADAGIVYATDAAITDTVKIVCAAPEDSCEPVVYPIALTQDGTKNPAAKDFLAFLQTEDAAKTFQAYGFGIAG